MWLLAAERQHLRNCLKSDSNELTEVKSIGGDGNLLAILSTKFRIISSKKADDLLHFRYRVVDSIQIDIMAAWKPFLSAGLLFFFVPVILLSSYACAGNRPAGVYQRGRAHTARHAGVGRTAARNFKAGFLVAKTDASKLRKNLRKHWAAMHAVPKIDSISRAPAVLFPAPKNIVLDLSPVLNL
jgi:hypothetical protein